MFGHCEWKLCLSLKDYLYLSRFSKSTCFSIQNGRRKSRKIRERQTHFAHIKPLEFARENCVLIDKLELFVLSHCLFLLHYLESFVIFETDLFLGFCTAISHSNSLITSSFKRARKRDSFLISKLLRLELELRIVLILKAHH